MRDFFKGDDPDAAAKKYLEEVERLETPPATPATARAPEPVLEDDLYLPEDDTAVFDDEEPVQPSEPSHEEPPVEAEEDTDDALPEEPEEPEDEEEFLPESLRKKDQNFFDKVKDWFDERDPLHQKLILGAIAVAILIIIAFITLALSPGNKTETETPVASEQVAMEETAPIQEGALIPASANAQCAPDHSTPAQNAFDPQEDTAWVCERSFGVDGTVLEMSFTSPVEITKVGLVPGFNFAAPRGEDEWLKHRVVTRVLWRIGDEQFVQEINPARSIAEMSIPTLVTDKISMTVLSTDMPVPPEGVVAAPPEADTFAVSTITLTGKQSQ